MEGEQIKITAAAILAVAIIYLYLIERVLTRPHSEALEFRAKDVSDAEVLEQGDYSQVNPLSDLPKSTVDANIIVVGGSGSVGSNLVDFLLQLGAKSIRIVDIVAPRQDILENPSVDFVKVDISNSQQVKDAFNKKFQVESDTITVHHTASAIRFWERSAHQWKYSYKVNPQGTQNVIDALKAMPHKNKRLLYTSTAAVCLPNPRFMRLRKGKSAVLSDTAPLPKDLLQNHYHKSKRMAEKLVLDTNGKDGIQTISLRPGMAVIGPKDLFLAVYLLNKPNPVWSGDIIQIAVDARDVARSHIFADAAMVENPKVRGQAYLITGEKRSWDFSMYRRATQVFAGRDLGFVRVPAWLMYLCAHLVEAFFYSRHMILESILGQKVENDPAWAKQIRFLQPAMFDTPCFDVIIDDSRARQDLGYRNAFTTAQMAKFTVDEVEKSRQSGSNLGKAAGVPISLAKASDAIAGDMKRG